MPILSKPSSAARTAVIYVTVGALTEVWSGIWYSYLKHNPPPHEFTWSAAAEEEMTERLNRLLDSSRNKGG